MPRNTADSLWKVLPFNATDLERDLLVVAPFEGVLDGFVPRVRQSKLVNIPDNWIPWLIIEYGLGAFGEFQSNQRTLVEQGPTLNRLRGTKAGMLLALSWLGYDDADIREETRPSLHFAEYQIYPGQVPDALEDICRMVKLARLVQPVRSRPRRLVHGYDIPMLYLDDSPMDDYILDNYSGVWSETIPGLCAKDPQVWLSFAGHHVAEVSSPVAASGAYTTQLVSDLIEFGLVVSEGEMSVESGEVVVDPSTPVLEGDIIIDGEAHLE